MRIFSIKWPKVFYLILILPIIFLGCSKDFPNSPQIKKDTDEIIVVSDLRSSHSRVSIGGKEVDIQAELSNQNNEPVPGEVVRFRSSLGTITDLDTTDQNGLAFATLISGSTVGESIIKAEYEENSRSITVYFDSTNTSSTDESIFIEVSADSNSMRADGITTTPVRANVTDQTGNPVEDGTYVQFTTSIGNINPYAVTDKGEAVVQFSSNETGVALIRASVGDVSDETTIHLLSGKAATILLSFDPKNLGVKDSGRNQSVGITADVRDSKNNTVSDGTLVQFSIFASPGGGETLSSYDPIPTVNGKAEVSLLSGIRSGTVRIQAEIVNDQGQPIQPPVRAISTEIMIFAGPPYIEDVNDRSSSHLTVGAKPLNIYGWHIVNNTAVITAVVGDKYNNPVPVETAVYFTTTGGVISTHTGYTNEEGIATVTIHSAQPYPTIDRYYNTFTDPNASHSDFNLPSEKIPGPIPDFEYGEVLNSQGDYNENDGIVRILATSEGVDSNNEKATAWAVTNVVFSGTIHTFTINVSDTSLSPGETAHIQFQIYDVNGNPIVPGSTISAEASAGKLSWMTLETDDPGVTLYDLYLTNDIDPNDPEAQEKTVQVTINVDSENGKRNRATPPILLKLR